MKTQIDKSKELETTVVLLNNKLHFGGMVDGRSPVSIDYIPPLGDGMGYTSLELLLLSFSSCLGSALLTFLRKMQKTIVDFEIQTKGIRRDEHPTGFKSIIAEIKLTSPDVTEAEINKLIKISELTYCPVWAMIKGNVDVEVKTLISGK
jgi:putative redox protein